jgi:hypothetical protein
VFVTNRRGNRQLLFMMRTAALSSALGLFLVACSPSASNGPPAAPAATGGAGGVPSVPTGGSPAPTGGTVGGPATRGAPVAVDSGEVAPPSPPDATVVMLPDGGGAPPAPGGLLPGLTSLFDGTTLNGWMGNPMIWSVKDGEIYGVAKNGGQLIITKDDYDDFRMILSTKLISGGKNHLGVCFWGSRAGTSYGGCKLVIPPDGGSWDYAGSGGLKGAMEHQSPFTNVDWHQSEILAHMSTGTIQMASDGKVVLTWKAPNPGVLKKGPIGLQIHAGASEVAYKDISIEVAPKDDRLLTLKP